MLINLGTQPLIYQGADAVFSPFTINRPAIFQPYLNVTVANQQELFGSVVLYGTFVSSEGYIFRQVIGEYYFDNGVSYGVVLDLNRNISRNSDVVLAARRLSSFSAPSQLPDATLTVSIDLNENG